MIPTPGDVQFFANTHVLHARTAYTDHVPPLPRRHLPRLWIATSEGDGGWKLPFHDSGDARRGGVRVNGKSGLVVLEAE